MHSNLHENGPDLRPLACSLEGECPMTNMPLTEACCLTLNRTYTTLQTLGVSTMFLFNKKNNAFIQQ